MHTETHVPSPFQGSNSIQSLPLQAQRQHMRSIPLVVSLVTAMASLACGVIVISATLDKPMATTASASISDLFGVLLGCFAAVGALILLVVSVAHEFGDVLNTVNDERGTQPGDFDEVQRQIDGVI